MKKEIIDKFKEYGFVYVKPYYKDDYNLEFLKLTKGMVIGINTNKHLTKPFQNYILNIHTKDRSYPPIHFNLIGDIDKTLSTINDLYDNIKNTIDDLLNLIVETNYNEFMTLPLNFLIKSQNYYADYYNDETKKFICLHIDVCGYEKYYLLCHIDNKTFKIEISEKDYHLNESQLDEFITELAFLKLG